MNRRVAFLPVWILLAMLVFVSPLLAGENSEGIVVWKLKANKGVEDADVNLISNFVTNQVAKYSGRKVISEADIRTILKGEETRQHCGAEDTTCVVEIGAALGVPEAVSGDIGKLDTFWMLNLRRINVRSADVIGRSSLSIEGKMSDLIRALPGAVAELFGKKAESPPVAAVPEEAPEKPPMPGRLSLVSEPSGAELRIDGEEKGATPYKRELAPGEYGLELRLDGYKTAQRSVEVKPNKTTRLDLTLERDYPMNPYRKWGYVSFFTGLGLAAFGGIATWRAKEAANDVKASGDWGAEDRNRAWSGLAVSGYTLGGAAMISGIALWALSPGDKAWWEDHQACLGPAPGGNGVALSLGGRW